MEIPEGFVAQTPKPAGLALDVDAAAGRQVSHLAFQLDVGPQCGCATLRLLWDFCCPKHIFPASPRFTPERCS